MSILQTPNAEGAAVRRRVMRIVSGLHAGASRPVAEQETLLIGSGDDCDVVLADAGVARHHALMALAGDEFTIRALDAPLNAGDRPLYPGDPITLQPLQRIGLGEAALAVGFENDPGWAALAPQRPITGSIPAMPQLPAAVRGSRRWPLIGALAALSLASVAIFAAVVPARMAVAPPETRLAAIARDLQVADAEIKTEGDTLMLLGTVKDGATREAVRKRVTAEGIDARVDLRSGEDIASDVRDALRAMGLAVNTRYLGGGDVEVIGDFDDKTLKLLTDAAGSRMMTGVNGVRRLVPNDTTPNAVAGKNAEGESGSQRRIIRSIVVAINRGPDAYVETADGKRYRIGQEVPGWGRLTMIGQNTWVTAADGSAVKLQPQPRPSFVDVVVGNGMEMNTPAASAPSAQVPAAAPQAAAAPAPDRQRQ